jgi:hypothetical protein
MTIAPFIWQSTNATAIVNTVLTAVSNALTGTSGGPVKRTVFEPGSDVAWDACDCGQLALVIRRRYTSRSFPTDGSDLIVGNCENVLIVFDCALSIVRCVPISDINGKPPSPAALGAAAQIQDEDAYTVWNTTYCTLVSLRDANPRRVTDFIVNDQTSLGPQGGCSGTELHFKFGLYVPCGC